VSLLEQGGFAGMTAETIPAALRFANAVGAMATLQKGAIPALPTRAAVEAFLKDRV